MQYSVELSREAAADIDELQSADRKLCGRIIKKLASLEDSPQAGKPLVGNHAGEFFGLKKVIDFLLMPSRQAYIDCEVNSGQSFISCRRGL